MQTINDVIRYPMFADVWPSELGVCIGLCVLCVFYNKNYINLDYNVPWPSKLILWYLSLCLIAFDDSF